ncbi:hypothetical protein FAS74_004929, partial [Salmonella enterica]|nr:hypothetical protein [Salmonella enterica]
MKKALYTTPFSFPGAALALFTSMLLSGPVSAISLPSLSGAGKSAGDAVGNAVSDGLFY